MLTTLRKPLSMRAIAGGAVAILAGVTLYCFVYNALGGRPESLPEGASWALVNVIPWFLAFERAKRARTVGGKGAILLAALLVSLALHLVVDGVPAEPVFQLIRRLPWLGCVALLLALVGLPERRAPEGAGELPLLPNQIDWVSAAGNYVELHGRGRTIVYRASLNSVEAQLARHGFLRVHRSTLVRRGAIASIRRIDLLLEDGTSLKLGKRYRSALNGSERDIRPFVPAE